MEAKGELYNKRRELRDALSALNGTPLIETLKQYIDCERAVLFSAVRGVDDTGFPVWKGQLLAFDTMYNALTKPRLDFNEESDL